MSGTLTIETVIWEKSSYSNGSGGQCVEFSRSLLAAGTVPVRDSKSLEGPAVLFKADSWSSFVSAVRSGDFHGML